MKLVDVLYNRFVLEKAQQITFLKQDYIGFHFNSGSIFFFFEIIVIVTLLFFVLYCIGRKIKEILFPELFNEYAFFLNITFGYIFIGTFICFLGLFSQLKTLVFFPLLFFILYFCSPGSVIKSFLGKIKIFKWRKIYKYNFLITICLFIIAFTIALRLLPPDIGADAVDYHTQYPKLYVDKHTMMVPAIGGESFVTTPQLAEMMHVIPQFFGVIEADRYIHFGFFLLVLGLLVTLSRTKKENKLFHLAPLLFAFSPLAIHIAPSAYGDFEGVVCFLLSVITLTYYKNPSKKVIVIAALLFGGFLATKIWALALFPVYFIYLFIVQKKKVTKKLFLYCLLFFLTAISISMIWYIRSYMISGNPLYFPAGIGNPVPSSLIVRLKQRFTYDITSIRWFFVDYFPLTFLGLGLFIFKIRETLSEIKKIRILQFSMILVIFYVFLPSEFNGRYSLPWYSLAILISSVGFAYVLSQNMVMRVITVLGFLFFIGNYLIGSLLILPYGIGMAKTDPYLVRAFVYDQSTYYDFNHEFTKNTARRETVATYNFLGMYYADFQSKNIYYYLDNNNMLFKNMKKAYINKLLIRGGDINWFCNRLSLPECKTIHATLLTSYPPAQQYLYKVE